MEKIEQFLLKLKGFCLNNQKYTNPILEELNYNPDDIVFIDVTENRMVITKKAKKYVERFKKEMPVTEEIVIDMIEDLLNFNKTTTVTNPTSSIFKYSESTTINIDRLEWDTMCKMSNFIVTTYVPIGIEKPAQRIEEDVIEEDFDGYFIKRRVFKDASATYNPKFSNNPVTYTKNVSTYEPLYVDDLVYETVDRDSYNYGYKTGGSFSKIYKNLDPSFWTYDLEEKRMDKSFRNRFLLEYIMKK